MLLFLKRFEVIGERPDLGANSLFEPCGALTLDGYSIPIAPNRHFPIAMGCNNRAPVYHFLDLPDRELAPVGFGDLRQVGGRFAKAFGQSAIATPIHTMTRHAGDFIFDNSEMRILRKHGMGQSDIER